MPKVFYDPPIIFDSDMNIYIILVLLQVVVSASHLVVRATVQNVDPNLVSVLRLGIASAVFVLWRFPQRHEFMVIERSDYKHFFLLGVFNLVGQLFFITGLKYTIPPNAALLYALTPAVVFGMSAILFGERGSRAKIVGLLIAFGGAGMVLFDRGADLRPEYLIGNLMEFAGMIMWSCFTITGKRLVAKYNPFATTAVAMVISFMLLLCALPFIPLSTSYTDITLVQWGGIAYIAIGATVVSYALYNYALSHLEASKVTVFNNLQPVLTTLFTIAIFQQYPSALFVVGGIIALIGVVITQKG